MRKFWYICAGLLFGLFISAQAWAGEIAALVSEVSGTVTIKTGTGQSAAKLLASIPPGTRIDLAAGAKLSLIYVAKGDEYRLSGPGSYQIDAAAPQTISGSAPAKHASLGGALGGKKIRSENVAQATLTMRSSKKIFPGLEPLSPSNTKTLADPLQLDWSEPATGLAYQLKVIDKQYKVMFEKEVYGNTCTLPQQIALAGGEVYQWQISTHLANDSLLTANTQFTVASNETRELAAKLKPGKEGTVSERVVYGLWLEAENLTREARIYWKELAREYPDHPDLFDRAARGL